MYDYDTGQLTDMGALSLTLNAQSMNDSLDNLQTYIKKRQQIIDDLGVSQKVRPSLNFLNASSAVLKLPNF